MGRRISAVMLPPPGAAARDEDWAGHARDALRCAALLLGLLLVVDAGAGHLDGPRALLWTGLSVLLLVILVPPRVSAGAGWLASHGLLRRQLVRTDRLVSVRCSDGVAQRLVLRDADGCRAEVDPRVFLANPALWHRLDEDSRAGRERGTLLCGEAALRALSERIDRETAHRVFTVSGLE